MKNKYKDNKLLFETVSNKLKSDINLDKQILININEKNIQLKNVNNNKIDFENKENINKNIQDNKLSEIDEYTKINSYLKSQNMTLKNNINILNNNIIGDPVKHENDQKHILNE